MRERHGITYPIAHAMRSAIQKITLTIAVPMIGFATAAK